MIIYSEKQLKKIRQCHWDMISRCYNPKNHSYQVYGGRGIKVCDRWKDSFDNFLEDVGPLFTKENNSLDRINNDGDYSPENCQCISRVMNTKKSNKERIDNGTHHWQKKGTVTAKNLETGLFQQVSKEEFLEFKDVLFVGPNKDRTFSEERSQKLSDALKGMIGITNGLINKRIRPEDLSEFLENGWFLGGKTGRIQTQETKEKIRISKIGKSRKPFSEEWCDNIGLSSKEVWTRQSVRDKRKETDALPEVKARRSDAQKGKTAHNKGKPSPLKGIPNGKKGIPNGRPSLNKGKIFINNGIISKLIHPEELPKFLLQGFVLGRKKTK